MSVPENIFQLVYMMSMSANQEQHELRKMTDIERELVETLPGTLKSIGPECKLAWGPAVFKDKKKSIPGTSWYVGSAGMQTFEDGEQHLLYVVAIGGAAGATNMFPLDKGLGSVVDLDKWTNDGPEGLKTAPVPVPITEPSSLESSAYIANGFAQALFHIINEKRGADPDALITFLRTIIDTEPDARIIFAGHSLGGALAPALAYTLAKAGLFGDNLSSRFKVYSTAGQSPGNLTFAKNFEVYFPSSVPEGYQQWNVNIANQLDIIPCGYCMDEAYTLLTLGRVPAMYGVPALKDVEGIVAEIEKNARSLYYPINTAVFQLPKKFEGPPKTVEEYISTAWNQHVELYNVFILGRPTSDPQSNTESFLRFPFLGHIAVKANIGSPGE